jgi:wyosine [tRNA(Phe)-imidazoG37] synthetase (radical SAM superfamily)
MDMPYRSASPIAPVPDHSTLLDRVIAIDAPERLPPDPSLLIEAVGALMAEISANHQNPAIYRAFRRLPPFMAEIMAGLMELAHGGTVNPVGIPVPTAIVQANLLSVAGRHDQAAELMAAVVAARGQSLGLDNARFSLQCRAKGVSDDLSDRFCSWPFERFDVLEGGKAYLCCAAWQPIPVGNLFAQSWADCWNSPEARAVRRSIHDGSFCHCDKMVCPLIQQGLPLKAKVIEAGGALAEVVRGRLEAVDEPPTRIDLSFDRTCNLSCPACRRDLIALKSPERALLTKLVEHQVLPLLAGAETVNITGSGDPFASKVFRHLLSRLDPDLFPKLKVLIATNAVLFDPAQWAEISHLKGRIARVAVSVDAVKPETYSVVRRGGDWERLQRNLRFIAELRRAGDIERFILAFVVQAVNWREMPAFIAMAKALGVDTVHFSCLQNWGTWSPEAFAAQAVHLPIHPEHEAFRDLLDDPVFADPWLSLGDVAQYRRKVPESPVALVTSPA